MLNLFSKKKKSQKQSKGDPKSLDKFSQGIIGVKDIISPEALEVDFSFIRIGNFYFRTLFVAGYPRFVNANWLAPLINFDRSLDISMFVYPVEGKGIMEDLKRKIAEMEAEIQTDMQRGKIVDIDTKVKLEDARVLREQLAKGAERFFQFALYITIPAKSEKELNTITERVQSTLGSLLIVSKKATLQMEEAFKSVLPTCQDRLMITRNMDTTSLATTFPFTSSELSANEGIMYGINEHNGSLVVFDRFSLENANTVVLAKSGGGKSIAGNETVLIQKNGFAVQKKIGPLIDQLMQKGKPISLDEEMKGIINPGIEVFTFGKNLKSSWSKVTVAARKKAPKNCYRFLTASGREITTTGDHNLVVLQNGQIQIVKGSLVKRNSFVPLPRLLPPPSKTITSLNLLSLLKNSKRIYIKGVNRIIAKNYQKLKEKPIDLFYDRYLYKYKQNRSVPLSYFLKILEKIEAPGLKNTSLGSRNSKSQTTLPVDFKINGAFLRLLGYIISEGTITNNAILISATNPEVIKNIKDCFKKLHLRAYQTSQGIVSATRIFTELVKATLGKSKAADKKTPYFAFNLSNKLLAQLIKTYFEGDGTVGKHCVTATSKSKKLISDLVYLLLRFRIHTRVRKKFKRATNSHHQGNTYYQIVISGTKNVNRFAKNIGFITREKEKKLKALLGKPSSTNVDIIPGLEEIFQKIYNLLYSSSSVPSPANLSPIKRKVFSPSRSLLKRLITEIEERAKQIKRMNSKLALLRQLPELKSFCQMACLNKKMNSILWQELGESWRLMKTEKVVVGTKNVLRAYQTASGQTISLSEVKKVIYSSFSALGESLQKFDKSLWTAVIQRPAGDTSYQRIVKAAKFLIKKCRERQIELNKLKKELEKLQKLANSDLFWDPIIKIKKVPSKQKYVYDLTVDSEVFLAGTGGVFVHNSYLVKLEALRSLMLGTEIIIIDPEAEYFNLSQAVGGEFISFSQQSPTKINPFDLSDVYEEGQNELSQKILSLHGLFKIIMGEMSPQEEATLDQALVLTYKQKGITPDPATQKNEPPLMEDLYKTLIGMESEQAINLAARMEKFVKGSLQGIFNQQSNIDIKSPFTVFCIKELESLLRPIAMYIILDFVWRRIKRDLKKRLLVVDEAWYLMKYPDSALFLHSMAKRARKYYLGLTTITQDVEDFLASNLGKSIITNSSIQILLKQSPAAIDKIVEVFYLSQGEKNLLLSAQVGRGLFFAGTNHVALHVVASENEHGLITSSPQELLKEEATPGPSAPAPA